MTGLALSWFAHLLQAAWQNTIVALLVLFLLRVLRGTNPSLRHALICIALLKFVIPPMLPLPTGIFSAAPPAPAIAPVHQLVFVATRVTPLLIALMFVHALGTAVMLLRLAREAWWLRGVRLRAVRDGDVFLSRDITVPMTVGILRPAILLPAGLPSILTPSELAHVMAHEREHVRRRDVLRNALQEVVIAFWWFHPVVRMLGEEARLIREECCDDAVLASGACDHAQYARTLMHAATFATRHVRAAAAIAESSHSLVRRVRRLAARDFIPSRPLGLAAMLLVAVLALLLLPGLRISASNRIAFDHEMRHVLFHR